tara:strand:+ start:2736 stop:3584 length:849 start_codon:yes stop_codon:yes gene_type:complete
MKFNNLKSWGKINLSLNVIKRLPNNYHKIESLITFLELHDEIKIRRIHTKEHKISFSGKFSERIEKKNTIIKLMNLLDKKKIIKGKKFQIKVKKNIPQKSGMGGGSMNASCILKHLIKKKIVNLPYKKIRELVNKIGSDVVLGLEKKNSILMKSGRIVRLNKKMNLFTLIVMPKFGCSTHDIFSRVRNFSKSSSFKEKNNLFTIKNLVRSNNDLESIVFKKYPKIKNLKYFLSTLPNVAFARMTGTGSAVVAYFKSKKSANTASKIFNKKYKKYWYVVSKTI